MMKYTVNITDDALANMESIYNYIAYDLLSPENAKEQYDRIANAILSLDTFPKRFKMFDAEPEHSLGIRKMIIDNYLVCYIINLNIVTVIAVFYGASDIHSRLKERNE